VALGEVARSRRSAKRSAGDAGCHRLGVPAGETGQQAVRVAAAADPSSASASPSANLQASRPSRQGCLSGREAIAGPVERTVRPRQHR
jgi:hypothetical protein